MYLMWNFGGFQESQRNTRTVTLFLKLSQQSHILKFLFPFTNAIKEELYLSHYWIPSYLELTSSILEPSSATYPQWKLIRWMRNDDYEHKITTPSSRLKFASSTYSRFKPGRDLNGTNTEKEYVRHYNLNRNLHGVYFMRGWVGSTVNLHVTAKRKFPSPNQSRTPFA
jgi:hypothetical protein